MSRPLEVVAYSGYRGEEEPREVVLDGERLAVREIRRRWRAPDGRCTHRSDAAYLEPLRSRNRSC